MRPYRFLTALLIFFFHIASAQGAETLDTPEKTKNFPISGFIAFSLNTMIAEGREYALAQKIIVSDLKWPLTPSISYTVYGGLYFPKGIYVEGNLSYLQPMSTASMTDTDFDIIQATTPQTRIIKFSKHNCSIIEGHNGTAKIGLQLPIPQAIALRNAGISLAVGPMLSFYYSTISWHSNGGYLQYAKENPDGTYGLWNTALPKIPYNEDAVSYRQYIMIPAIGISVEATFPHHLTLLSDFHLTSGIIAEAEDIHHARDLKFIDVMNNGWATHGTIRLNWNCVPSFSVFLNIFYQYCITTKGYTLIYNGITSTKPDAWRLNAAGTSLRGGTCSIGFAFLLGR